MESLSLKPQKNFSASRCISSGKLSPCLSGGTGFTAGIQSLCKGISLICLTERRKAMKTLRVAIRTEEVETLRAERPYLNITTNDVESYIDERIMGCNECLFRTKDPEGREVCVFHCMLTGVFIKREQDILDMNPLEPTYFYPDDCLLLDYREKEIGK
jgi:hypothetical protein